MLLSVIITAHDENLFVHKTLKNIKNSLSFLKEDEYEIIVHLDNPSEFLLDYFKNKKGYVILKNNFNDLALSRNYSIKRSKGKYIFIMDGDDLVSENFLRDSIKILESSKTKTLLHAEYRLLFWDRELMHPFRLIKNQRSHGRKYDLIRLVARNQWISSVIGDRKIFLKYPYRENKNGYGMEDYDFNIRTTNDNILHKLVPNTVYFYRQKKHGSLLQKILTRPATTRYSSAFNFSAWRKYKKTDFFEPLEHVEEKKDTQPQPISIAHQSNIKEKFKKCYISIRNNKIANAIISPIAEIAKRISGVKLIKTEEPIVQQPAIDIVEPPLAPIDRLGIKQTLLDEWKKVALYENWLYPNDESLARTVLINPKRIDYPAGYAYYQIAQQFPYQPDYIFFINLLQTSGSEKVLLNYLLSLRTIDPTKKIAIISTNTGDNTWADKLPNNSFLVNFGNIAADLDEYWKDWVFSRMFIQSQCKKIHIINSMYAYEWIFHHQELVKHENIRIDLSIFGYSFYGNPSSHIHIDFADPYATSIAPVVRNIYSDNKISLKRFESFGFKNSQLKAHYQPITPAADVRKMHNKIFHILWASRISPEKNIDLLLAIAKQIDPKLFHIDVYGELGPGYDAKMFSMESISYLGDFEDFNDLPLEKYDVLLYTSYIDGLPNILLEAASHRIPIIATNVGGISDFIINNKTGILIDTLSSPQKYIEAIKYSAKNPQVIEKYSKNAIKLIEKRHSYDNFNSIVRRDIL